jgi:fructose-1-phosphate kinase PfkB-like protein
VDFGGKGFNVSRLLKSLGATSTAVGFLGGRSGELLQDGIRDPGIGADFVWVSGETRTNISIVTETHNHYIKVNEKGPLVGVSPVAPQPPAKAEPKSVHARRSKADWR